MKGTHKDRRSKRVPATHRLLLTILGPNGAEITKEIVSTVELSQYGARVRGRRIFRSESEGVLTRLSSGRQARIRVAWQQKLDTPPGFFDTGVELLSGFDYWGIPFSEPAAAPANSAGSGGAEPRSAPELLEGLIKQAAGDGHSQVLEAAWCGLIEQLEASKVLTREELVSTIRSIASPSLPTQQSDTPDQKLKR